MGRLRHLWMNTLIIYRRLLAHCLSVINAAYTYMSYRSKYYIHDVANMITYTECFISYDSALITNVIIKSLLMKMTEELFFMAIYLFLISQTYSLFLTNNKF